MRKYATNSAIMSILILLNIITSSTIIKCFSPLNGILAKDVLVEGRDVSFVVAESFVELVHVELPSSV